MYNYNYTYVNYLFNYIYTILGHLFLQHTGRTLELVIVLIDDQTEIMVNEAPVDPEFSRTARAAWARLIQKAYEVDAHAVTSLRGGVAFDGFDRRSSRRY